MIYNNIQMKTFLLIISLMMVPVFTGAQIPMERILNRVSVPAEGNLRGLVDTIGFAHTEEQIEFIVRYCEQAEKQDLEADRIKYNLDDQTSFIYAISPHDDYMLAARNYIHIY